MNLLPIHIDYSLVRCRAVIGPAACPWCARPALEVGIIWRPAGVAEHFIECHYCGSRWMMPDEVLGGPCAGR